MSDKPTQEGADQLQYRLDLIEKKMGHRLTVNYNTRGYQIVGWGNNPIMHWERYFSYNRANEFITFLENVLDNKALMERRERERAARE